jgi:Ran GTPase-activating protein (RanGAP) involved in mRNA processing and transport
MTLSSINFAECHLGPKAAAEVAKVCAASAALTSLNISKNRLTCKDAIDGDLSGLIELGKAMAASSTLSSINFAECYLGPKATAEVAKACAASAALTKLNVSQNSIGDEAMQALQRVAPSSVQLIQ